MKYTIGEFAKILGVTVDTLRTYEKSGIITPQKDASNNYRYYTDLDCRNILMSRWFRSFDIPLKKATQLTVKSTMGDIRQSIEEKCESLRREIEANRRLLARLEEIAGDIAAIPEAQTRYARTEQGGTYRIRQTRGNDLVVGHELKKTVSRWMELLPHSFFSLEIPLAGAASPGEFLDHDWGLALGEADFAYFGLKQTEDIDFLPPAAGISTVIATSSETDLSYSLLAPLFAYATQKSLTPAGNIRGKLILTERESRDRYRTFIEVFLPTV